MLPNAAGMMRNGTNPAIARITYHGPPWKARPYAVSIGRASSTTIQLEWSAVSKRRLPYSESQSTGDDTSRSRSFARKKLDRAAMMFDSSRMAENDRSSRPSSRPASNGPISSTPAK